MAYSKLPGAWSYEDILSFPDDDRHYEIFEGAPYDSPSTTSVQTATIFNLIALLLPIVANVQGRLFTAPLYAYSPVGDPVQPDNFGVLPGGEARVELRGIKGAPDLVIEVVSPSNRARDLLTKPALYARADVREYWLVDPDARGLKSSHSTATDSIWPRRCLAMRPHIAAAWFSSHSNCRFPVGFP